MTNPSEGGRVDERGCHLVSGSRQVDGFPPSGPQLSPPQSSPPFPHGVHTHHRTSSSVYKKYRPLTAWLLYNYSDSILVQK
ncbi:hypothetical protein J6590_030938 [Homalodisca vitripennis]|nr:hypothetical protein J6590_030938 [Homalodisca vitripennis]